MFQEIDEEFISKCRNRLRGNHKKFMSKNVNTLFFPIQCPMPYALCATIDNKSFYLATHESNNKLTNKCFFSEVKVNMVNGWADTIALKILG